MRCVRLVCALVTACCCSALAENSVVLDSKTVSAGLTESVGIYLTNEAPLRTITIPLIVREVTPGVYPTTLSGEYVPGARLDGYLTEVSILNEYDNEDGNCKNGQPGGLGTISAVGPSSPDGFVFTRNKILQPNWPAGTDGATPSIRINFTAPYAAGFFDIDSTCCDPACHILFVEATGGAAPNLQFTRGVVEVYCPGDLDCDSVLDEVDNCPAAYNPDQADWDGDGVGDVCGDPPVNSVVVESMTIGRGASGTIGVFLSNKDTLRSLSIRLVVREMTTGVYPTALAGRYVAGARLEGYLTEVDIYNEYDIEDGSCKSGQPGGFGTIGSVGPSSPDAMLFSRSKILGANWPAGSDNATPSIAIDFTAPEALGSFEIDSTCTDPSGHLIFVKSSGAPAGDLTFTRAVIQVIECDCPHQCDLFEDGFISSLDLAAEVDILFGGREDPQDPVCPTTRGDFDADGFTTAVDLGLLIDHMYGGGPPPVDPCAGR